MKKHIHKLLMLPVVLVMTAAAAPVYVYAAAVSMLGGQISVTDTQNTLKQSGTTLTATAKGSIISKKTNTITVTNTSGVMGTVTFDYSAAAYHSFTIGGAAASASGTYSAALEAGGSVALAVKSNSGLGNTTATLTLSGFSFREAAADSAVPVIFDSAKGSVTVDGSAITSGTVVAAAGGRLTAVAAAGSGCTFLGWVANDSREILYPDAGNVLTLPKGTTGLEAVFVTTANDENAWFRVGSGLYPGLDAALAAAKSSDGTIRADTVVLMNNAVVSGGPYTIPGGVTLLIPCDANNSTCIGAPLVTEGASKPTVYRTMTLGENVSITVEGSLSIAGRQTPTMPYNGTPTGGQGMLVMPAGSRVTVSSGGKLYAWGYVTRKAPGSEGTIVAENGAEVYEDFQVRDWRGGKATSGMIKNRQQVLPVSQYYVQNIEVPLTLEKGASEKVYMTVKVNLLIDEVLGTALAPFIGENSLFRFTTDDASLTKDYIEETDRAVYTISGGMELAGFAIDLKTSTGAAGYNIDTADYVMPLTNNITVELTEGSGLTVANSVALLPGTQVYVREGSTITIAPGTSCYVYSAASWAGKQFVGSAGLDLSQLRYVSGGKAPAARTAADLKDALIQIDGTVDARGTIYTTCADGADDGADICSTGTGVIKTAVPSDVTATTYQYNQAAAEYGSIAARPLRLKNAGTGFPCLDTGKRPGAVSTYVYDPASGRWTCHEACPGAADHTTDTQILPAVAPTCTAAGLTEGKHCSVCGEVLAAQEEIEARGYHRWSEGKCECGAVFGIRATNVALEESLDLYFYVDKADLDDPDADFRITMTKEGMTESLAIEKEDWETYGDQYRFCYPDIPAKEMTDDVTVKVSDAEQVLTIYTESVRSYAHNAYSYLAAEAEKVEDPDAKAEAEHELAVLGTALADMLNYGAACQTVFEYRTDDMADYVEETDTDGISLMALATKEVPSLTPPAQREEGTFFHGSSFSAKNKLKFTFYFDFADENGVKIENLDTAYAVVTYDDPSDSEAAVEIRVEYADWYAKTDTVYGIDVNGIPVIRGRDVITCTVYDGSGNVISAGNTDSIVGYVSRIDQEEKKDQYDAMEHLLRFVDSASAYFIYKEGVAYGSR